MISDADRKLIKVLNVTGGVGFSGGSGFTRNRVVTFSIGDKGPFQVQIPLTDYNAANVQRLIEAEIETLRGIGAL